jgi:hypothetical protein
MEESNVQPVRCPVTVCGDIHGQFVRLSYQPCVMLATPLTFSARFRCSDLRISPQLYATMKRV